MKWKMENDRNSINMIHGSYFISDTQSDTNSVFELGSVT